MRRSILVVGLTATAASLTVAGARDARACGGCFHPPTQVASDITDERMLLSVSTTQTTLFDQIRYSGSPSSFAWVLPIHGTVDVGLSADVLFDSIDELTATQITAPPSSCQAPQCLRNAASSAPQAALGGGTDTAVTVTKQENVGPYATVQLHATDSSALDAWLLQNGYQIPDAVVPVINQYVMEGFDFLAMKLLPTAGIQAMRPVRVTSPGASLSLPLRMAAIGTGPIVGITIWIVADGRYEPQNFPFFHIEDSDLVWDWSTSSSNYTTLRAQNDANLHNSGWEIESSITLNQQTITNVILNGGQYYGGFGGVPQTVSDPSIDYLPVNASDAGSDGGTGQTAEEARTADIAALFAGIVAPNARVTRVRSDIAHSAMTVDLLFRAAADQSELPNVRTLTRSVNESCPVYNGCTYVGTSLVSNNGSSGQSGSVSSSGSASSGSSSSGSTSIGASGTSASGSLAAESGESGTRNGTQGGCVAAPSRSGSSAAFGALTGMLGLAFTRNLRARRRASRKGSTSLPR